VHGGGRKARKESTELYMGRPIEEGGASLFSTAERLCSSLDPYSRRSEMPYFVDLRESNLEIIGVDICARENGFGVAELTPLNVHGKFCS